MVDHLGSHVLQRAAESVALSLVQVTIGIRLDLTLTGPSEIANFEHVILVDEQVLRLQISMNETILMQEVNASDRLYKEVKGCLFGEAALFFDEDEEVTLGDILHDQVNVLAVFQVCIHAHNIHMLQLLVDLNFTAQRLFHLWRLDHTFVQFFNGHF